MEKKLQEFIISNLKELGIDRGGTQFNCVLKGKRFSISPEGGVVIQGEIFNLPEGSALYEKIHTEYRERILNKFLDGTIEEPGYEW